MCNAFDDERMPCEQTVASNGDDWSQPLAGRGSAANSLARMLALLPLSLSAGTHIVSERAMRISIFIGSSVDGQQAGGVFVRSILFVSGDRRQLGCVDVRSVLVVLLLLLFSWSVVGERSAKQCVGGNTGAPVRCRRVSISRSSRKTILIRHVLLSRANKSHGHRMRSIRARNDCFRSLRGELNVKKH